MFIIESSCIEEFPSHSYNGRFGAKVQYFAIKRFAEYTVTCFQSRCIHKTIDCKILKNKKSVGLAEEQNVRQRLKPSIVELKEYVNTYVCV